MAHSCNHHSSEQRLTRGEYNNIVRTNKSFLSQYLIWGAKTYSPRNSYVFPRKALVSNRSMPIKQSSRFLSHDKNNYLR